MHNIRVNHSGQLVSDANRFPVAVGPVATDPGLTAYRNTALAATKQAAATAACALFGVTLINPNTVTVYLKLYDAAVGDVTVGTTTPAVVYAVPAGNGTTPGQFLLTPEAVAAEYFSTAITVAAVLELADSGTTAPSTAIYARILTK